MLTLASFTFFLVAKEAYAQAEAQKEKDEAEVQVDTFYSATEAAEQSMEWWSLGS